jgi:hypothetical protein
MTTWMIAAVLLTGVQPPTIVMECRLPLDSAGRVFQLVDHGGARDPRWWLTLRSVKLGQRLVELPLRNAQVNTTDAVVASASSANGGVAVQLRSGAGEPLLDVFVNYELEVNVWRDLSPEVDQMNTSGPRRDAICTRPSRNAAGTNPGVALANPQQSLHANGASEWMITAGNAWGDVLFHSAGGHDYALQTVSWGRVLTEMHGPGFLRGRFEWAVEAMPIFGQYRPDRVFGVGASPLVWRWNLAPRGRYAVYGELAGGALWTSSPVPRQTTSANFTAHAGIGLRIFMRHDSALVVTYRLHHISNGNRLERNPGVNAHALQMGWNLVRPAERGKTTQP